ncbi:hypothetical protein K0M31_012104 [Melipona bicolor]|uniref:Uncharacterized protein n=1 Tax=Melipona bicolor TaxID=60889 RepID=A0AA40KVF4_9HYME|nr:hypothetical protein K0M31_012104 [Melipona bicolor]
MYVAKSYVTQFKYDFNENAEFNAISIRNCRSLVLKNVDQPLLYPKGRTEMMDLLKFIPPSKHDCCRNLKINPIDDGFYRLI